MIKDISYLELWQPFHSAKQNHLCNFRRGYRKEKTCEIIFNLDQMFKRFLIKSSGGPCVQWNRIIYAIFVGGIMGNINVKAF